jgi:hypothetical protein
MNSSVSTPSFFSAMCSSTDCGLGTRGSPSTTWIMVGVVARLMYFSGDWSQYASKLWYGSSSPR